MTAAAAAAVDGKCTSQECRLLLTANVQEGWGVAVAPLDQSSLMISLRVWSRTKACKHIDQGMIPCSIVLWTALQAVAVQHGQSWLA